MKTLRDVLAELPRDCQLSDGLSEWTPAELGDTLEAQGLGWQLEEPAQRLPHSDNPKMGHVALHTLQGDGLILYTLP